MGIRMAALKLAWMVLVSVSFIITALYLYLGSNISISIRFTVRPKESMIDTIFKKTKQKEPKPIMNIKKFQRKWNTTTSLPTTTRATRTTTKAPSTQIITTPTAKLVTSQTEFVTSTQISVTSQNSNATTGKNKRKPLTSLARRVISRKISPQEKKQLFDLLSKFIEIAERLNLTYLLTGGSLLGSWRHHGMIPWDDDIDVIVNETQKPQLLAEIKKLEPDYIGPDTDPIIKFYSANDSKTVPGRKWQWPFLDICFFKDDGHVMWDTVRYFSKTKYDLAKIFPLHKRPFENLEVNAPRDMLYVIDKLYKSTKSHCTTWSYSHIKEKGGVKTHSIDCRKLKNVVPFVHRTFLNGTGTMEEVLKIGTKVIHTKYVQEERSSLCDPYDLKPIKQ